MELNNFQYMHVFHMIPQMCFRYYIRSDPFYSMQIGDYFSNT